MAYEPALDSYRLTIKFPNEETYALTSQFQRAAVSVPANSAEGYERKHQKKYQQYWFIAKGSLGEIGTYLMLARDLRFIVQTEYDTIDEKRAKAARILVGLIKSLT